MKYISLTVLGLFGAMLGVLVSVLLSAAL